MEARILNQSEEHLWSDFVKQHPLGNIHQTPAWGHFRNKVPGHGKYWIIVLEENSENQSSPKILAGTLLLRQSLPHGYSWLYAPRGPLLSYDDFASTQEQMSVLMGAIKEIARKEKAVFLRVDPMLRASDSKSARAEISPEKTAPVSHSISDFPPRGGQSASINFPHFHQNIHGFQPDHTLFLDLTKSEDDLLKEMKPKGRYNIKLAEKKGVTIHKSTDVTSFYKILSETTSRDGFHGHDQKFYQDMLDSLGPNAVLYLAEYEGQVIAGCLNTFYKDTATYYYGASSNEHRNVMAPYLLQWQAIREAKAKGYKFFDFFGIAPTDEPSESASQQASRQGGTDLKRPKGAEAKSSTKPHPWAGVTEFKKKFGGTEVSYQKPQEFIFKKALYFLYRTYKKFR